MKLNNTTDLVEIINNQRKFQEHVNNISLPADLPTKMHYHLSAGTVEIAEILQLDERWKDWKKNPRPFDKDDKLEEFADAMIFLINGFLFSGYEPEALAKKIHDKIEKNYVRQAEGY